MRILLAFERNLLVKLGLANPIFKAIVLLLELHQDDAPDTCVSPDPCRVVHKLGNRKGPVEIRKRVRIGVKAHSCVGSEEEGISLYATMKNEGNEGDVELLRARVCVCV